MNESGERSPEALMLPRSGMTGMMSSSSSFIRVSRTTGRTALWPRTSDWTRIRMAPRTMCAGMIDAEPEASRLDGVTPQSWCSYSDQIHLERIFARVARAEG